MAHIYKHKKTGKLYTIEQFDNYWSGTIGRALIMMTATPHQCKGETLHFNVLERKEAANWVTSNFDIEYEKY